MFEKPLKLLNQNCADAQSYFHDLCWFDSKYLEFHITLFFLEATSKSFNGYSKVFIPEVITADYGMSQTKGYVVSAVTHMILSHY